jgi:hypothetical protein
MRLSQPDASVRYGSFLRTIPPTRRVGDYAHAASRIVNAIFKRLENLAPQWGPRARADLRICAILALSGGHLVQTWCLGECEGMQEGWSATM